VTSIDGMRSTSPSARDLIFEPLPMRRGIPRWWVFEGRTLRPEVYSDWKSAILLNGFYSPFWYFAAFWAIEIAGEFLFVRMAVATPMIVLSEPFCRWLRALR
jgi:hypothetical protein